MKKLILSVALIAASFTTVAQVGVGTTTPKASLDIAGDAATAATIDGMIVPRLTADQLGAKTAYGVDQNGTIVYITTAPTAALTGEFVNVTAAGFYYYSHDGATGVWNTIGGGKFVDGDTATDAVFTEGLVGIGTTSPNSAYDVHVTNSDNVGNVFLQAEGRIFMEASENGGNALFFRKFGGPDLDNKASVNEGDALFSIGVAAWHGSGYAPTPASISSSVDEAVTGSAVSAAIKFSTSALERLRITGSGIVGIGVGEGVDGSAILELNSTTQGFLPPKMRASEISSIASPAEGLIVYCTNCSPNGVYVYDGSDFVKVTASGALNPTSVTLNAVLEDSNSTGGSNNADNSPVTSSDLQFLNITSVYEPFESLYQTAINTETGFSNPPTELQIQTVIDAVNSTEQSTTPFLYSAATKQIWMDRNLGATQKATSSTDAASYGDYYQWGRTTDGHEISTSSETTVPVAAGSEGSNFIVVADSPNDWLSTPDELRWNSDLTGYSPTKVVANDPCPTNYRVPGYGEFQNEITNFSSNDASGAFNALALPVAGYRAYNNGNTYNIGTHGRYWTIATRTDGRSWYAIWSSSSASLNPMQRASGLSVRCIRE